jgi:hypothetical protein
MGKFLHDYAFAYRAVHIPCACPGNVSNNFFGRRISNCDLRTVVSIDTLTANQQLLLIFNYFCIRDAILSIFKLEGLFQRGLTLPLTAVKIQNFDRLTYMPAYRRAGKIIQENSSHIWKIDRGQGGDTTNFRRLTVILSLGVLAANCVAG